MTTLLEYGAEKRGRATFLTEVHAGCSFEWLTKELG